MNAPVYDDDNIFAKILRGQIPCHKVYEDDKTLAFMDIMPQAVGHVLVIPKCAAVELLDLPSEYALAVIKSAKKVLAAQRRVLGARGVVQMQLSGEEAGQSVFHYHMHLIPTHVHKLGQHAQTSADAEAIARLAADLRKAIDEQDERPTG